MIDLRLELMYENLSAAKHFYCSILGFQIVKESPAYIGVINGGVRLGLGSMDNLPESHPLRPHNQSKGKGIEIVIEVEEIETYYQELKNKCPIAESLQTRSWGGTDFRVMDPEGYYIRFTSVC